jgi:23S rRNA (adenine2503-C2)-methyltransferase
LSQWVFHRGVSDWAAMTDISKPDREVLATLFTLRTLTPMKTQISRVDRTKKTLFETDDHQTFETVWLQDRERTTLCVSTQIGCKMACRFCATGKGKFGRNLTASEIVEQVLAHPRVDNIVFMGMGEPLDNYENLIKAIRLLESQAGFSPRRMTVSTVGVIPKIRKLMTEKLPLTLAVSLNATTDVTRQYLMPAARRYRLEGILQALRDYVAQTGQRVTIEYVMFKGVNDSEKDAKALVRLTRELKCQVNLIQYNDTATLGLSESLNSQMLQFKYWLKRDGLTATIRYKRGRDIEAACGQLKGGDRGGFSKLS